MKISRQWAMPSCETFSVPPISQFVHRYLGGVSVDPFARNSCLATHTNDLDPSTIASHHLPAHEYLQLLRDDGVVADLGMFDPPYSPRQISECYKRIGLEPTEQDTQNSRLYKQARDSMDQIIRPGGVVLSFGWNTVGMGIRRGYEIEEILLVCHGAAHNDTICLAERKLEQAASPLALGDSA